MKARELSTELRELADASEPDAARILNAAADALDDARRVAIHAGDAIGRMRAEDAARHGLVIPHAHIIGIINRNYTGDETP